MTAISKLSDRIHCESTKLKSLKVIFTVFSFYFTVGHPSFAAEGDTIVTDRPDFVESSNVVGKGRFQLETSFAWEKNNQVGIRDRTLSTPTLLRIGVHDDVELRLETDGFLHMRTDDFLQGASVIQSGYADVSVGVKWHLFDDHDDFPSIGLLVHVDLPSGSKAFRGNGNRPSLRLAAEWDLPDDFSLGIMPGLNYQKNQFNQGFVGGVLGVVLGKAINEQLRTFIEFSAPQIARANNGGSQATFDVGAAYLISKSVQIDTAFSKGLNKNTPDFSWTIGVSVKY